MILHMTHVCELHHVDIHNINAEVSPVVTSSIVQVIGVGKQTKQVDPNTKKELEIVLTKHVGLEGSNRLLYERKEILKKRFPPSFLQGILQKKDFFCDKEIEVAIKEDVAYMHVLGEGGIYAALWNMADELDIGLTIEGDKISIYQETIEVCEYLNLNPYQLASEGSILMLTNNGIDLQEKLQEYEIHAAVIGKTTIEKQRIIRRREDVRFLDKPAPDELLKIFGD